MPSDPRSEASLVCKLLVAHLSQRWEGKNAVLELKEADYQWRQMEWVGWYFEFKARTILTQNLGGGLGPRYGLTQFDYRRENVWDFKVHVLSGQPWAIVNDKEAVDLCIRDFGFVGIILAVGEAQLDDERRRFKAWHDSLKGRRSLYEEERIRRGASSRIRKRAFMMARIEALGLTSGLLREGVGNGWVMGG